MTLLGLYRVLDFRGKLTLNTITDEGKDLSSFIPIWREFIKNEFKPKLLSIAKLPKLESPKLFPILKSGPISKLDPSDRTEPSFTNSSAKALILAARVLLVKRPDPVLLKALEGLSSQYSDSTTFMGRLRSIAMACHEELDYFQPAELRTVFLGKLGFKPEPAGKIRVFAMVDAWTQ